MKETISFPSVLRFLVLIFLLGIIAERVEAQYIVKGSVTDATSLVSLPGVSILLQGTNTGTVTNADGKFQIEIPSKKSVLVFSFIGYQTREIEISKSTLLNIALEPAVSQLDALVVVGYTTEKKKDLTGSVSVVSMDQVKRLPSGNVIKNIQGRVPGVFVTTDGSPGSGASIRIRGSGTLNNNDPLYIIDGVPTKAGMHELNSNDIESIQILKDAASASIYGSRAANGVIVITTKSAKNEKPKVEFTSNWSMQRYTTKLSPLNTEQRGRVYWQACVNDHLSPQNPIYSYVWNGDFNNPILGGIEYPDFIDPDNTMPPADTRWYDEISRPSVQQNYNLTVSKGGEKSRSLISMGWYDNNGIIKETNFTRFNLRVNSSFDLLNNKLKIGENFTISYQEEVLINAGDVLFTSLVQQPIVPVHTVDGGWGGPAPGMTDRQNPVRLIEDNKQNKYRYSRPFGNVYVELDPVKNLSLKTSFGVDYSMFYQRTLQKSYVSGFLVEDDNTISNHVNVGGNYIWSNTANYKITKGKHNVDLLAGTEMINTKREWFSASRQGLVTENLNFGYLNSGSKNQLNSGGGSISTLLSFFGKANYSLADKYLLSLTIRRDGSSRFGKNNRYGNFPAVSGGWRLSEEKFFKDNVNVPVYLKLRAGWGMNGNQEINDLAIYNIYQAVYSKEDPIWDNPTQTYMPRLGTAYDIAGIDQGQLPSGYIYSQMANDNLKWESTSQANFGIDFTLYEVFSGSVDYFIKKTKDILYYRTLLSAVGEGNKQMVNGGDVQNSGLEFLLNYHKSFNELTVDVTANLATLKNKVLDIPDELLINAPISPIVPNEAKTELDRSMMIGHSVNSIYGYVADGLFQNQEEVNTHAEQTGKGIGRIRYKDLNGDNIINEKDQQFIGTVDPKLTYGLNVVVEYGQFDLTLFIQGLSGISVYNGYKTYTDFASLWPGTNWGDRTLDAWSPTNTGSTIPRLTIIDRNNEGRISTYFIEPGSYLKFRNITLGYELPDAVSDRLKMQKARVYFQGQNLLTIKNKAFTGTDPENPNYAFPIPAIYSLGVELTF
ncbi:MAG: TonB-dependent receptor [Bacteroidales bacterium]|nr:TonB-dependent receptor [Bacteroidales bacterium]